MKTDYCPDWREVSKVAGPCIRPGGSVLTERALAVCGLPSGSLIADVGCGTGGTLEYLLRKGDYWPVGLDCSEILLATTNSGPASGRLVRGRAENLPFRNGSLDALLCECVLSIITEKTGVLKECTNTLKDGGFLILSDVFRRSRSGREEAPAHSPAFDGKGILVKEEVLGILGNLGFSLVLWEEHDRFLKAFAAQMILAGIELPQLWQCGQGREGVETDRGPLSYFLLVAQKTGIAIRQDTRETIDHG